LIKFALKSWIDVKTVRDLLRADGWNEWANVETDQKKKLPSPPIVKPFPKDAEYIDLVKPEDLGVGEKSLMATIGLRRSHRKYSSNSLTLEELSFLLWATQGIQEVRNSGSNLRTVPSGGARHSFETYLAVFRVDGLEQGLYRYSPIDHKIVRIDSKVPITQKTVGDACRKQAFAGKAAVVFIWTTIPYRMYWRYERVTAKIIAQDSGHMCQNLYLACTSIGAGTCAIGAYDQNLMDQLVDVNGEEEFVVYVAPVGKLD
jgi:SagB-type dehydrogenase family enzyme